MDNKKTPQNKKKNTTYTTPKTSCTTEDNLSKEAAVAGQINIIAAPSLLKLHDLWRIQSTAHDIKASRALTLSKQIITLKTKSRRKKKKAASLIWVHVYQQNSGTELKWKMSDVSACNT